MNDSPDVELKAMEESKTEEMPIENSFKKNWNLIRVVTAFWILGLCNNYIYVIMLSAAHDIINKVESQVILTVKLFINFFQQIKINLIKF